MKQFSKFIGMDVHKETIAVAIAEVGGGQPVYFGEIANTAEAIGKLLKKLGNGKSELAFCYEAGPCGYAVYWELTRLGHHCEVVAPSLIPRKAGERVKTDRRDALSLARLYRSGELTAVWVPGKEQEAIRDLTRAREDLKRLERQSRQRLGAFLLRHGKCYGGKTRWTQAHYRWLETVRFEQPVQQIVFQEYVDTVKHLERRVEALEKEMQGAMSGWSLGGIVEALMALRGIRLITALTLVAELGDITRFDSPRQLMAYLGLVPSEYSSGAKQQRGSITKTGNGHVRRLLVEAGWTYRFAPRKSYDLQRRAERASEAVQAIAWKAQKRLCGRYRHLSQQGKQANKVCTAIARELIGFIWAIAREVNPRPIVA
jgi:transposase